MSRDSSIFDVYNRQHQDFFRRQANAQAEQAQLNHEAHTNGPHWTTKVKIRPILTGLNNA